MWSDVDLDSNPATVTIRPEISKSKRGRVIPLNQTTFELLSRLYKTKKSLYVFTNSYGDPFKSPTGVDKSWQNAKRRAGLNGFRFHDLRHSTATRLLASGVPMAVVSKVLGHHSISVTERYAHVEDQVAGALITLDENRK